MKADDKPGPIEVKKRSISKNEKIENSLVIYSKHKVLAEMIPLDIVMANVSLDSDLMVIVNLAKIDYRNVHLYCSSYLMDRMRDHLVDDNLRK